MENPQQNDTFNTQSNDEFDAQAASFKKTYESIEVSFASKVARLIASKNLIAAEAKLSLSAILLALAISLILVIVAVIIWTLLNVGIALIFYHFTTSIGLTLTFLFILNICLGLYLFSHLKNTLKLIGFPATMSEIEGSK
ncbi:hypothetical protein E2R68_06815 [Psychromonas sp. RZ22]|uniref:hypothetical protein n=1 Tax=Psychromonas algarum TaxID=2555643 RepID=UPI00106852D7|nr:hypothetical protein [Psychromonas sp. RZ22]TEW54875.1 hypothetical protein E2R68_06815 [Psychromonas sp. RZ22]